jgi:hypothetical protein
MEKQIRITLEHGSREWGILNPMQNDKVSMFGTPRQPRASNIASWTESGMSQGKHEIPGETPEDAYL